MLNKSEFASIRADLESFDKKRESVIQLSREIIQLSKQIIYALHRNDMKSASAAVSRIRKKIRLLPARNYDLSLDKVALQEYVEAIAYYEFMKSSSLPTRSQLGVDTESYLLGLCDLTGELVRRAVNDVINKKMAGAKKAKAVVEFIYGEFLKLDLRNGELRKKSDQIKYNLMKLEDIMYDIEVKNG